MTLPAPRTYPRPHTERTNTFRAAVGYAPAAMTRSGSVRLVDLKKCCLPSGRLVPQHFLEHVPARIQDGFSHLGLGEFGTAHVSDDDQFIFTCNPGGRDVQMVFARVGDLGMDRSDAFLVSGPLSLTQGVRIFPVMLKGGNTCAIATGGHRFQSEIDADLADTRLLRLNFTLENDVPAATGILRETTCFYWAGKFTVFPKADLSSKIGNAAISQLKMPTLERYPTQTFAAAKAGPELRATPVCFSGIRKYSAYLADCLRRNAKLFTDPGCERGEREVAWPLSSQPRFPFGFGATLNLTAIIPHKVTGPSLSIQMLGVPRVFHSVLEG